MGILALPRPRSMGALAPAAGQISKLRGAFVGMDADAVAVALSLFSVIIVRLVVYDC